MLIELRVENHRSLRDEQALTMEAGRVGDEADPRPRKVEGYATPLLTVAALYGANASGKSNVLAGLAFMRDAVLRSHRSWAPDAGVPRDPFAWGPRALEPSLFEVTLLLDGVRTQYGFVADSERFLEEWLYAWPKGRRQIWLERERNGDADEFKFGENLEGENRVVEKVTRPNSLFLAAAVQLGNKQLRPLYSWFASWGIVNGLRVGRFAWEIGNQRWLERALFVAHQSSRQLGLFGDDEETTPKFDAFRGLLQAADTGIVDVKFASEEALDSDAPNRHWQRRRVLVRHKSATQEAWLPLEEESQGTLTLFRVGPLVLDALHRGTLVVVDELEASLHPLLALQLVRLFNDPKTNPRHAQLLFTTHDTHLLGSLDGDTALRRDQVWLTEKDAQGATVLYPLTDYKPRKAENLERGYLQGRYGAIPFLGALAPVEE